MKFKMMCRLEVCLALLLVAGGMAAAQPEGLVAHWPFDEGSGTTAFDSTGNGNDGVFNGDPQWVPGIIGGALEFNGDDFLNCGNGDTLQIQDQITIAFWFKVDAFVNTWEAFLSKGDNSYRASRGGGNGNATHLGISGTNAGGGNGWFNGTQIITDNTWHHFTGIHDGTNARIYVDGVLDVEVASTGQINISTFELWIGTNSQNTGRLLHGLLDDIQIYNRALSDDEILSIMPGLTSPTLAGDPAPEDEATDIWRDQSLSWASGDFAATHNVYFGANFADVNEGAAGTLVVEGTTQTSFDPGRLAFSETNYWRVDEVNGAPDFTVHKGGVWSFTVEPFSIPISNITATASSSFGVSGPEKTIDGSGLVDDLHGASASDMWISGGIPATIEYAFDRAYKLHELWIWNSNQLIETFVGFGAKDVVIEHSLDGENWTVLEGVGPLAPAPGSTDYAHNNTIDFGGAMAKHVRLNVNSVQGIAPQASLSEVRFFFIPTFATRPSPESGATDVAPDTSLSWGRDGREAGSHDVYVGTDANSLSLAASVSESNFDTLALDLQLGQSYAWRVDEVNEAMDPSTWEGTLWSFTTAETISIDDMESYRDEEFLEIWATWVDGFDDPANGSLVGNGAAGSPETGIVHGGSQSLPMEYGIGGAALSEATRTFDAPMDWTKHGVQGLVLFINRDVDNTGNGQIYVKVNDTKIVNPEDPAALPPAWDQWTQWTIDLTALGVDLTQVRSLTVGVEGAGAQGILYVDDIQLVGDASQSGSQVLTWFEAEAADILGASWQVVADPTASGGNRIGSEDGDGDDNDTAPGAEWVASYTIDVPADGVYGLVLRAQEASSDSFWVRIVGATSQSHEDPDQVGTGWVRFNGINAPSGWAWDQVHSNDHGNAVVSWTLPAGTLTVEIAKREDGTYLDAIAVTQ